eukprot:1573968-Ditylum_brightwellii.AAC.1
MKGVAKLHDFGLCNGVDRRINLASCVIIDEPMAPMNAALCEAEVWQLYAGALWYCWGDMCPWVRTGTPCVQMLLRSVAARCSVGGTAANSSLLQIVVHVR